MSRENTKTTVHNNPEVNPCIAEQEFSYNCLSKNGYDKKKCTDAFINFRDCKRFWGAVKGKRIQRNTKPFMPPLSERQQIIDYLGEDLPYINIK